MNKIFICLNIITLAITGCSKKSEPLPPARGRVIVMMYHRIVTGEATNIYERSVADFGEDLKYLKVNSIKVISFSDIENISKTGKMPLGNTAVITFDDGDYSWYSLARPLLLQYQMKATFFLWTSMIARDSFLSWKEVEHMSHYTLPGGEKPFTFGSHTFSHQFLLGRKAGFSDDNEYNLFLDYELRESKNLIEAHTSVDVTTLALPFGDGAGDPEIIAAAIRNGYRCIRTSVYGAIESPDFNLFIIPSLPMLDNTSSDEIENYLNGK
ncbi:MAG TPA: polysaccharide deacetylase family protein [Anaerovoracaceae bacterium]|nr:polysaccharide deacetylase family protein [Anaerovoracaceae bacterium]